MAFSVPQIKNVLETQTLGTQSADLPFFRYFPGYFLSYLFFKVSPLSRIFIQENFLLI